MEGAFQQALWPFKLYFGGVLGSGRQPFSWIHINDAVGIFLHILENNHVMGILNGVAPNVTTNAEYTKTLASTLGRFAIFRVPAFVLKLIFGEDRANMLLKGSFVLPRRVLESGYVYQYPDIKSCLVALCEK